MANVKKGHSMDVSSRHQELRPRSVALHPRIAHEHSRAGPGWTRWPVETIPLTDLCLVLELVFPGHLPLKPRRIADANH